jgi:tetratricopeptide (TPR) repeat protein
LSSQPLLFVFDDFEQSLEPAESGEYSLQPQALYTLGSLLAAIRETASESRVVVASRYRFAIPGNAKLHEEGLESLRDAELDKKVASLDAFERLDETNSALRERAMKAGAGNPGLLERLNRVLSDQETNHEAILTAIEAAQVEFREEKLLRELLSRQSSECRRLVAALSVFNRPASRGAVEAAVGTAEAERHLDRAVALGLVEQVKETGADEPRYYVSTRVRPFVEDEITPAERVDAGKRAAAHLCEEILSADGETSVEELLEVHRLAMAGGEKEIAATTGTWIATWLLESSRFRQAETFCHSALASGDDYRILHMLANAERALGKTDEARSHFERALEICSELESEESADVAQNRSSIMNSLASLLMQQGEIMRATALLEESLALVEQAGDAQAKAAILHELAGAYSRQGDIGRVKELLEESLGLGEEIGEAARTTTLSELARVYLMQGDFTRAMDLLNEALEVDEKIGNLRGRATTLHNMAHVLSRQGETKRAVELLEESLELKEKIDDVRGKAATLASIAWIENQERPAKARKLYLEAARLLASAHAWSDLIQVLRNLGAFDEEGAKAFLAQALWLSVRVDVSADAAISIGEELFKKVNVKSKAAPLIAAAAFFIAASVGEGYFQKGTLQKAAGDMITACIEARGIAQNRFASWFESEGLDDPGKFLPSLDKALEKIVGDEWLFDRRLFEQH